MQAIYELVGDKIPRSDSDAQNIGIGCTTIESHNYCIDPFTVYEDGERSIPVNPPR